MCAFAVDAARSVRATPAASTEGVDWGSNGADRKPAGDDRGPADADRKPAGDDPEPAKSAARASTGFRKALALSLMNPYQIVFWLTVGVGLLRPGTLDVLAHAPWLADAASALGGPGSLVVETGSVALLVGFFGGIGVWITGYPATVAALGERSDRAAPIVAGISAVLLAGFGVVFLLDAGTALL